MQKYTNRIRSKGAQRMLLVALFIFSFKVSKAFTFITAFNGNWNNQGCWFGGALPSFNIADTVIIKHHIVLPSNLTLLNGAHLQIESTGGLCGHVQLFVNTGTSVIKFGILEIDVLNMTGGTVDLLPPGNTIFTQYGLLSGGVFNNTSNFFVGPWFECQMPEYQFLNGLNDKHNSVAIKIFPNPVEQLVYIDMPNHVKESSCLIFDSKGALLLQKQLRQPQKQIDVSELQQGLFFLQIISNEKTMLGKFYKM
jgi:hypothetical protein